MPHTTLLDAIRRWEPPTPEDLAGQLAGYAVVRFLARGGMAAVYEGRQLSLDRPVALKVLPPELGSEPGFQELFEGEARVLARLSHPGVVGVIDFGKTAAGSAFIVLELIGGTPLHVWAPGRSHGEKFHVALKLLEAVAACHEQGVVHADLKPENVFVEEDSSVKLVDFGLATQLGGAMTETTGPRFGTPPYTAPEAYFPQAVPDARSDVYSLGQTLVTLFAETHASAHPPLDELERLLGRGDLAAVLEPMFRPRPADRTQSVAEVLARLKKLPPPQISASAPVSRRDLRKSPRRQPAATPVAPPPAAAAPVAAPAVTGRMRAGQPGRRLGPSTGRVALSTDGQREKIIAGIVIVFALGIAWWALSNWKARTEAEEKASPAEEAQP